MLRHLRAQRPPTAAEPDGKQLIGERSLRYLVPSNLRQMNDRHKAMCGCPTCGRNFSKEAAERHIPSCAQRKARGGR